MSEKLNKAQKKVDPRHQAEKFIKSQVGDEGLRLIAFNAVAVYHHCLMTAVILRTAILSHELSSESSEFDWVMTILDDLSLLPDDEQRERIEEEVKSALDDETMRRFGLKCDD